MIGYPPDFAGSLAGEHRRDMLRDAARANMTADLPDRDRHETPRQRSSWWSRATSFVTHRATPASA